ncbi:MAG: DUF2273 domain-containing protein [Firmicutes bacterium]|nr:DUF2273 domain-containing protein [Bacillota bacterium]
MEDRWARLYDAVWANKGKIFGVLLGITTGALVIKYGWLKALYFILCVGVGYYLGKRVDNKESLAELLKKMFPASKEK